MRAKTLLAALLCLTMLFSSTIVLAQKPVPEVEPAEESPIAQFFSGIGDFFRGFFAFLRGEPPFICGDYICSSARGETFQNCPVDCPPPSFCGDGSCDANEDNINCPADCPKAVCGDGFCFHYGENATTCPVDCAARCGNGVCELAPNMTDPDCKCDAQGIKPCNLSGADGVCPQTGGETTQNCPQDCPAQEVCGDGICGKNERKRGTCVVDCGQPQCGDGICQRIEMRTGSCPQDCA